MRTLIREKQTSTIVNVMTQEFGQRVTYVVDVMDSQKVASLEFDGPTNAKLNADGVDHLAALCGGTRAASR